MIERNRSAPNASVVPILVYDDVEMAIDFLCGAFGLTEHLRAAGRDGRLIHAQLTFGDGGVIIGRAGGPFKAPHGEGATHIVHVAVPDARAHYQHAREFGARIVREPEEMPFGELQYTAEDTAGRWWTFSEHIADVAPETWGATTTPRSHSTADR